MKTLALFFTLWLPCYGAIAFNTSADGGNNGGSGNITFSYTASSGSNRLLTVCVENLGGDLTTGVTYNGVSMTLSDKAGDGLGREDYLFYLLAPATGANNVVVTNTGGFTSAGASDYTGIKQSAQPDAHTTNAGSIGTSLTTSITTVADNSWIIHCAFQSTALNGTFTASTNLTKRIQDGTNSVWCILDTNGAITPAGATNVAFTFSASRTLSAVVASFSPAAAASGTLTPAHSSVF